MADVILRRGGIAQHRRGLGGHAAPLLGRHFLAARHAASKADRRQPD
jgi:hypothetical protein